MAKKTRKGEKTAAVQEYMNAQPEAVSSTRMATTRMR